MTQKKPVVLCVDDELDNVEIYQICLEENFDTRGFVSPQRALEQISEIDPEIVLSDYRMPGLSGVAFLEEVRKHCPNTVRLLITGYADLEDVTAAVKRKTIFDVLQKPLNASQLETGVSKAHSHFVNNLNKIYK